MYSTGGVPTAYLGIYLQDNYRGDTGVLLKKYFQAFIERFKRLRGDPEYVARGMAAGVFIGITPTVPFHTALSLALATLVRGSRPAAVLGCWIGNPVTMPLFYIASYEVGMLLLGKSLPAVPLQQQSLPELLKLGSDIVFAMIAGGFIIAAVPAVLAYFITRKAVAAYHAYTTGP